MVDIIVEREPHDKGMDTSQLRAPPTGESFQGSVLGPGGSGGSLALDADSRCRGQLDHLRCCQQENEADLAVFMLCRYGLISLLLNF